MTAIPFSRTRFKADTSELALQGWDTQATAPDWIKALRLRARDQVTEFGLPTPKLERWKYTNLPPKIKKMNPSHAKADMKVEGNTTYVSYDLSLDWVRGKLEVAPHGEAQYADMMLVHAANAFLNEGIVVDVPKNTQSADPLILTYTGQAGTYTTPHMVIRLAEGADFTIIEYHNGDSTYWNNAVMHIEVGKNARLRHYRIQDNGFEAVSTYNAHVTVERDGNYESFALTTGGALSRNQIQSELLGENGNCSLSGLTLLNGKQHSDTALLIEHRAPNCQSNQLYKTILDQESRGVFQGKIYVDQIAQKTDGYQLSNNLLLSQLAEMNIKPELEIYADDVKCSHGSTTGALDETPMFYLRSRGLSEVESRRLLLEAFIGQALEKITHEAAHKEISGRATQWLSQI